MSEIIYEFDESKWAEFKNNLISQDSENRKVVFCTNFTFCQNTIGYSRSGYDESGYYRDTYSQCSDGSYAAHSDYDAYAYFEGHQNHSQYADHDQSGYYDNHWDVDGTAGFRSLAHGDIPYTEYGRSTYRDCWNSTYHYDTHVDKSVYNKADGYTDTSVTHNLPTKPTLFGTESGNIPVLSKTVTLGLFSNDKDTASANKLVYYDVYLQRIEDLNGNILTGQTLHKIKSNVAETSAGSGYTFSMDTTLYDDGYYRIIAIARNAPDSVTTEISGDKDQPSKTQTFYLQDLSTDSIVSGNYDGINLNSGLTFQAGETASSTSLNGTLKSGNKHDMYSISKVLIRQNRRAFYSLSSTNILNFIFANDDTSDTNEGVYDTSTKKSYTYGSTKIVSDDSYANLRGWTNGIVAKIDLIEPDTEQYIQVTATLYKKSTGVAITGSTVTAQFPTNKSSATAYTVLPKGGGESVTMEGYLYWPATILSATGITEGLDELEIKTTITEYNDSAKATVINTTTSNKTSTNEDGTEGSTKAVVKVDRFNPRITSDAVQNVWLESATIAITSDDRFKNKAYSTSGTGSGIKEMYVKVTNKADGTVMDEYTWSVANGVISSGATYFTKSITIDSPSEYNTSYFNNISVYIRTIDNAGNTNERTIDNIKIDNATTLIETDIAPSNKWFNTQQTPIVTVSKPGGKPFTTIKVAETTSATAPSTSSAEWATYSPNSLNFTYDTKEVGRTTNTHYIHLIIDDGLHDTITKTIGPYKVDLETPSVAVSSTSGEWEYSPFVVVDASDKTTGSPLSYIEYVWKKSDGAVGETKKIDISSSNLYTYNNKYIIEIDDNTYDPSISCQITVKDVAGNAYTTTINNLKADKTEPTISINPLPNPNWVNTAYNTVVTVDKSSGAPASVIKIAETMDATAPELTSSEWKNILISNGGAIYNNTTTGKSDGQHYVHVYVEKGTYSSESDKVMTATFGPYKTDFTKPDVISFEEIKEFSVSDKTTWYWENPTYELFVQDDGGSKMKSIKYNITKENSTTEPTWIDLSASSSKHNIEFDNGINAFKVQLYDNAGNSNLIIHPSYIKVDTNNPVINVEPTIMGEQLQDGRIIGYLDIDISATDITSGIKVAKYAITNSPTPPALNKVGTTNSEDLGRTGDGWIDFSPYANIGVSIDLKAAGKNYIYVYIEDVAGRKYNSTNYSTTAPDENGIYLYDCVNIIPSALTGLELVNEENKLVFSEQSFDVNKINSTNLYAIKNISSMANFKLHYMNYTADTKDIKIEVIDANTGNVVRSSKSSTMFEIGDTSIDDINTYNFTSWWVNGINGQKLPSGVYEVKATLYIQSEEISSTSAYVAIKSNDLIEPVINYEKFGDRNEYDVTFIKDAFLENELTKNYPTAIKDFIQDLNDNHQTSYTLEAVDKEGKVTKKKLNPYFDADGKYKFEDTVKKHVTIIATTEDAFGNIARNSQVIDFVGEENDFDDSLSDTEKEQIKQEKEQNTQKVNETTNSVSKIETPSADNYIINGKKQKEDKFDDNPFSFME